jgi:hypothetical protein
MLISDTYKALNAKLHRDNPKYGSRERHDVYQEVTQLATEVGAGNILDYGCGKAEMSRHVPNVISYDPCVYEYSAEPPACDLVCCCDVLEHIEPDLLDNVLNDLHKLSKKATYLVISTRPASKILADGRNAHLIVNDADWWIDKIKTVFVDFKQRIEVKPFEVRMVLIGE